MKMRTLCKRIKFQSGDQTVVLLGVISQEDELFINFITGSTNYKINKNFIFSIEDTNIPFRAEDGPK